MLVNEDKDDISLNLSANEMKSMKKAKFKKYLKEKINAGAFSYLKCLQQSHSKVMNIKYDKLKIAPYLKNSNFRNEEKSLLFNLRTRMVNVKSNFPSQYDDMSCGLCGQNESQTQEHLLNCSQLISNCPQLYNNRVVQYSDIFQGVNKQLRCMQLFVNIMKVKEKLEEKSNTV